MSTQQARSRRRPPPSGTLAAAAVQHPLPLAHRLPNPPTEFVGRAWERDHLRHVLARGRVALIWGLGGLGKTALALETMHRHFAARVERTLYVGLSPTGDDVRARLVRALADAHAAATLDWRALLADPDSLVATAIDLADVGDHWIVLDDLQWTDPEHARHLLARVARFARRSRWIAISREDPGVPELAPDTLPLEAMASADLSKLAAIWAPRRPRDEIQRAVATAGGSPWQLRRALFGAPAADTAARDVLAGLAPPARAFVLALARIDAPVPLATAARFARVPDDDELAALERRGLIEQGPRGVRLHDVARAMVAAALAGSAASDAPDPRPIADVLAREDDPATALEGLRLLARQKRTSDVVAALDRRGAAWLAAGFAPELWRLLAALPDEPPGVLSRWRLRCTVEFDDREVLAAVDAQADPTPEDRLAWSRVLYRRGRIDDAVRAAGEAEDAARAAGDARVAADAGLFRAGATAQQGREREALALLAAVEPPDAAARARLDALAAMLLTALDERAAARERLERLRHALATLPDAAQTEVAFGVVQALYFLGQYRDADAVVRELVAARGEQTLALYHGRRLLYYRACIAVERAQFADARELLARLEPFVQGRSMFRAFVDYAACMLHLAAGELDAMRALLPRTIAGGRELGEWNPHHVEALLLQARLALLEGTAPELPDEAALPEQGYPARARVRLHRIEGALRAGERVAPEAWPRAEHCPEWGDTRAIARLVRARAALASGALGEAADECERALAVARESGSAVLEAEGWQLRGEVAVVAGDLSALAQAAAWLQSFGRDAPSPRFASEGELLAMAGSDERLEPWALEALATRSDSSPRAARRARALLGELPALDAFDRLVLDATRRAWRRVAIARVGGAPTSDASAAWTPGWGLDARTQRVWLPGGGERVDLADRPLLWRLLEVLAERGGRATKEDLSCAVWSERAYHPLKHDNRLRLAARKLRQAIERDPGEPQLLLTTDDGYALGGAARLLRTVTPAG